MASKLNINPTSGTTSESKKISFNLTGLKNNNGLRIGIENATHGIPLPIDGQRFVEIEAGQTSFTGVVNLMIPEQSAQDIVSLFATVEDKTDDGYIPSSMHSATYSVIRLLKDGFEGKISMSLEFASPEDRISIDITHIPNSRVVISINDRRFNILTKSNGEGSIAFLGKDVLIKNKSVN